MLPLRSLCLCGAGFLRTCSPQRHHAAEPQPQKNVAGTGQYRFAVASGEFRDAENLLSIEVHPTLPRIGTDLFQHYSEWQGILSEETLAEKQDLKNLLHSGAQPQPNNDR